MIWCCQYQNQQLRIYLLLLLSVVELIVFLLGLILTSQCYPKLSVDVLTVMSLFPCSTSFSISSLFKLDWIIEISAFLLTCKGEIYEICWRLPTIVFFEINISCFELLMTGILRRWFISDLIETMVSAVSKPSGSSISTVSKSNGILLLILP